MYQCNVFHSGANYSNTELILLDASLSFIIIKMPKSLISTNEAQRTLD